jgi:hypothetical protein
MWTYEQRTGILRHNGEAIATGYSGCDGGKNNPSAQGQKCVGPIPTGAWTIGEVFNSAAKGPVVMRLLPATTTETFGRDGFMIHGDSIAHPGEASEGCIILPRPARLAIAQSGDHALEVV